MIRVSVEEARLLTLARFGLGLAEDHQVMPTLLTRQATVSKLTPTAARVLEDTLARGTIHALAQGGWHTLGGKRLWQREPAPKPQFTPALVQLLNWLLFAPLSAEQVSSLPAVALTPAEDHFFAQFIVRQRDPRVLKNLLRQPTFHQAPLTHLMHGAHMAVAMGEPLQAPNLDVSAYAVYLEASQELLAATWFGAEHLKRVQRVPSVLNAMGQTQWRALEALEVAADRAQRRSVLTFVLQAASRFLRETPTADALVGPLDPTVALRERQQARQSAGSLMQSVVRLHTWDEAHRTVHFVDDGYAEAQALLKHWEPYRPTTFERAARLVEALSQLPT